eukprot:6456800-Amphidinium_carterae.1
MTTLASALKIPGKPREQITIIGIYVSQSSRNCNGTQHFNKHLRYQRSWTGAHFEWCVGYSGLRVI